MKFFTILICLNLCLLCFNSAATPELDEIINSDETAEEKGLLIAQAVKASDVGWGDMQSDLVMILKNSKGSESKRELRSKVLEVEGDGDKGLSIFDTPADIKGTALLTFSHVLEPDDQWIYLPALKRVKRINSRNKSGPFMGSEFAYEDMSSFEVEKYDYKFINKEAYDGKECYVIENYPKDEYSGYSKRVLWVDADKLVVQKIDFYDKKDNLLKTLTAHEYQLYLEKYWRPSELKMQNHITGKSTDLFWSNYEFNVGLTDQDFNTNTLKRFK